LGIPVDRGYSVKDKILEILDYLTAQGVDFPHKDTIVAVYKKWIRERGIKFTRAETVERYLRKMVEEGVLVTDRKGRYKRKPSLLGL